MRGRRPKFTINLDEEVRAELERMQRRTMISAGEARRARVILLLDDGKTLAATAEQAGLTERNARKWVMRFCAEGLAGLKDRPRPGRKPRFSP